MPIPLVLIVDANESTRALAQAALTRHSSCQVLLAASLAEGRQRAETEHPDVILIDVALPGLDIAPFLARRVNQDRPLVVILLAPSLPAEQVQRFLKAGVTAVISQPLDPETL